MVASSTLVNVSDDAEVRLVAMLAEAAPGDLLSPHFQANCTKSIEAGQAGPLLDTVLKDPGAITALMTIEGDEAISALTLLAALSERADRFSDLVKAVSQAKQGTPERKIELLSVLYNMRVDGNEKCGLLGQMIQLAAKNTQLLEPDQTLGRLLSSEGKDSTDSPQPPRLVALLDSWNVVDERRELYRTIAHSMPDTDKRKQRFLLLLLESYKDASVDAQALAAGKEAAIGAIRDPLSLFVHQRNMLSLPVIQALNKEDATLFGLLKVFQEGKLSDYQAFLKGNGGDAVLAKWNLDAEACTRNMRILSLCSLSSEHEEIPYSVIAETLQLEPDTVETWVIAAVSSGLLRAKMDQLDRRVMVERSVVRQFDMEQWKALQSRLLSWKQNVGNVLAGLKESQSAAIKPN
jgi:translation initiation factor 3 subunit M